MKDNPYSKIVDIMSSKGAKNNPPSIEIARVTKELPDFRIKIRELELDKDNVLIADYLLTHKRKMKFTDDNATGETDVSADHTHPIKRIEVNTDFEMESSLKEGDLVAVMPSYDRQTYIILARLSEVM